ncbi:hypothetical protein [Helicobacter sp. 13S00477-4]|uniref:hypothetical protein n=1 Tax=Helicobacter sp. 13S00477-4 TaxID=1905759 RepID=UPI002151697E|nr:hypothetical protein [Helicobacter sp. 13S00477-4]
MKEPRQLDFILEYFKKYPNQDISHPQAVDWISNEYKEKTRKVFRDVDRGIRSLHQRGYLIKVKKGVYRYEPNFILRDDLEDFYPQLRKQILERDGYKCVICGMGKKEGVECMLIM